MIFHFIPTALRRPWFHILLLCYTIINGQTSVENSSISWFGNTWQGAKWVQNRIDEMVVTADGTCQTNSGWDEAHCENGRYKDGDRIDCSSPDINNQTVTINGGTWSISGTDVVGPSGKTITSNGEPACLGIDRINNYLMVGDDGSGQHVIKFFDPALSASALNQPVRTFGVVGGIGAHDPGAGIIAGEVTPWKFWGITGCGTDSQGNIYVSFNQHGCGICSFTPDGEAVRWEVNGLFFSECSDFLPGTNGTRIFSRNESYSMDYTQPAGEQATWEHYTLNLDKYPDDARGVFLSERDNIGVVTARVIDGQNYLFMTNMKNTQGICIYRFNYETDGYIAIPAGHIDVSRPHWCVDAGGSIWYISGSTGLKKMTCTGIAPSGELTYESAVDWSLPDHPFNEFGQVEYLSEIDVMYLGGGTPTNDLVGCCHMGPVIAKYENWTTSPRKVWQIEVPFENWDGGGGGADKYKILPASAAATEDYLYVAYQNWDGQDIDLPSGMSGTIHIYDAADASLVGKLFSEGISGIQGSWIDIQRSGVHATVGANGEQIIVREENWKGKQILFTWTPPGTSVETHPLNMLRVKRSGLLNAPVDLRGRHLLPQSGSLPSGILVFPSHKTRGRSKLELNVQ